MTLPARATVTLALVTAAATAAILPLSQPPSSAAPRQPMLACSVERVPPVIDHFRDVACIVFVLPEPPSAEGNPLFHSEAKLTITNPTDRPLSIFTLSEPKTQDGQLVTLAPAQPQPGIVKVEVRDATGTDVMAAKPSLGTGPLAAFVLTPVTIDRYVVRTNELTVRTLRPGESVEQPLRLLASMRWAKGATKPGTYTVRAVFEYLSAPDGAVRTIASAPVAIEVTAAHVKQFEEWGAEQDRFFEQVMPARAPQE